MIADYSMFAACRCGEELFVRDFVVYGVYEPVMQFRREHENLGHELLHHERDADEYALRLEAAREKYDEEHKAVEPAIEVVEANSGELEE
jgi:hypothetical protein